MFEPFIKYVTLLRDRVPNFDRYPYSVPAVRALTELTFHPRVTLFAGENGSGKSTLLQAIAVVQGLNLEGGSRHVNFATHEALCELGQAIRVGRGTRRLKESDAYFYRADSFVNLATELSRLGVFYNETNLHKVSHGESFLTLLLHRFGTNGLYLLDEPEAALSPNAQLVLMKVIHELMQQGSQFIIATHSPLLLGYPDAHILWFSESDIQMRSYEQTDHYKVTRSFLLNRESMLKELLE